MNTLKLFLLSTRFLSFNTPPPPAVIKVHIIEMVDTGVNYDNWRNQDVPREFKVNVLKVFNGLGWFPYFCET